MKKSDAEIQAEINKLRALMPVVPPRTFFGDSNVEAVKVQIRVLNEKLTVARIFDTYEDNEHLLDAALGARRWVDGQGDFEYLSDEWKELISQEENDDDDSLPQFA